MLKKIEQIKKELEKQNLSESELARKIGIGQKNLNNLLSGRTKRPDYSVILALQSALNIFSDDCQMVDIFNMVAGGNGAEPEWHDPVDSRVIPTSLMKAGIRPVLVRGRSMEPTFKHGAVIGVDETDKSVIEGEAYAVVLPYSGASVKRLYPLPDGILIRSDNREFPEVKLLKTDIPDYFILGRVRWVVQEV